MLRIKPSALTESISVFAPMIQEIRDREDSDWLKMPAQSALPLLEHEVRVLLHDAFNLASTDANEFVAAYVSRFMGHEKRREGLLTLRAFLRLVVQENSSLDAFLGNYGSDAHADAAGA